MVNRKKISGANPLHFESTPIYCFSCCYLSNYFSNYALFINSNVPVLGMMNGRVSCLMSIYISNVE